MRNFLLVFMFTMFAGQALAEQARPIAVIVQNDEDANKLAAEDLSLIYWRKKQYWQGGLRIHPVNLHAEHPLRLNFSKVVLGSLPATQTNYWNGLYFHGTTPPYSVQSEEAVIRFVANTKGAIGYVDACKVDARVNAVLWINDNKLSTTKPTLDCGI